MKKNSFSAILFYFVGLNLLTSCKDIFEIDLSGKSINLISPIDSFQTNVSTQTFWWDQLEGAETYRLQIVLNSFSHPSGLLMDTLIKSNQFVVSFQPGVYQWRVRGQNNGSESPYSCRTLVVDSATSLINQTVSLNYPIINFVTNNSLVAFTWTPIYRATGYSFRVRDSLMQVVFDTTLTNTSLTHSIDEGEFQWEVSAYDLYSATPYSIRALTIDQTPPVEPNNLLPANGDTSSTSNVELTWNSDQSSSYDSLYIFSDSTQLATILSIELTSSSYIFTGVTSNYYYWKLKSFDSAGNSSAFTGVNKFYIQ